jgi:hypothetical protein
MTVAPGLPSLLLDASAGLIEARRNLLPERDDPENSIIVPAGNAIITDDVVQRPFNRTANLGTNRQHPVGALANYRDGTRIPAPAAPTSAPWTRNLVGVAESPTGIFTKNAGAANAYDAAVYSAERIVGDFEIIYRLLQKSDDLAVGVISAYGGANYAFIQHAILYQSNGASTVYSRGGAQIRPAGGYDAATIERLRRQGSRLILTRNNVEMLNLPVSSELALGLQASIARMGDAVEILRFGAI